MQRHTVMLDEDAYVLLRRLALFREAGTGKLKDVLTTALARLALADDAPAWVRRRTPACGLPCGFDGSHDEGLCRLPD